MVYKSQQSVVCVDKTFWSVATNATAIATYFPYFDAVVVQDKVLFPVKTPDTQFGFVITKPTGGAHTGCDLHRIGSGGTFCDTVTGDAFTSSYRDHVTRRRVQGFWGYLLPLHESINVFTGLMSPGWPSDWWADHRSPFPNAMDVAFLRSIAANATGLAAETVQALTESANIQLHRFNDQAENPGTYDPQVGLFLDLFDRYGGFRGYARAFGYAIGEDRLQWTSVSKFAGYDGDNNHGENLSEYLIAYLELGFGVDHDLTPIFRAAGVGTLDKKIDPYQIDSANVRAIANAHCSIRSATNAGAKPGKELKALQAGDFNHAIASGGSSSSCPSECTFQHDRCIARF